MNVELKIKAILKCDDLHDFIDGSKHYYGVKIEDKIDEGDIVLLYNDWQNCIFEVKHIFSVDSVKKLGLMKYVL